MVTSGFVDLMLLLVLIFFTAKGFITGFIRSVVTFAAVFIAFAASAAMPTIAAGLLGYSVHADFPNYLVVNRLVSFALFFGVAQSIGFLATGLFEKIGLGDIDKVIGLLVGLVTAVLVGAMPAIAIYSSATAYAYPPDQKLMKGSFFMRTYMPVTKMLAKPAKPKRKAS